MTLRNYGNEKAISDADYHEGHGRRHQAQTLDIVLCSERYTLLLQWLLKPGVETGTHKVNVWGNCCSTSLQSSGE